VGDGCADGVGEFGWADVGGAGSGEEDAVGFEVLGGGGGELVVGLDGCGAVAFAPGQRGGVDDDDVEALGGLGGEPCEGIGADGMARAGGDRGEVEIGGEIAAAGVEGVLTDVDIRDRAGPGAGGVERECAGEAEGIEDIGSLGDGGEAAAVVALVEVETGFLAVADIGEELKTVFEEGDRVRG
jgi:hypothetical protein